MPEQFLRPGPVKFRHIVRLPIRSFYFEIIIHYTYRLTSV